MAVRTLPELDGATYDVVVIGTGSAGKPLAGALSRAGLRVLAVERGRVGGECPYLACVPSKSMLLSARRHRANHPSGPAGLALDRPAFAEAVAVRDRTAHHRDDSTAVTALTDDGVDLVRATATVRPGSVHLTAALSGGQGDPGALGTDHRTGDPTDRAGTNVLKTKDRHGDPSDQGEPGVLHRHHRTDDGGEPGGATVRWHRALVLATGASAVIPPVDGLRTAPGVWTSDVALSGDELPERLAILGGGAIGCELAEVYASFGSRVTLIEAAPTLLPREQPWLGEAMARALGRLGVDVRTGTELHSVRPGLELHTSDRVVEADRLLVAVGKKPVTDGLESLGEITVDARMRVTDGIFAIGDLTAINPYTHGANHQARVVADELLGHGRDADHSGTPRVVYTDPPVLAVGDTERTAAERGVRTRTARTDVTGTTRSAVERTQDRDDTRPAGLELIADADSGVLIGAAAIGPEADSWAAALALAVRARLTVAALADQPWAFPSWSEAIAPVAQELAASLRS